MWQELSDSALAAPVGSAGMYHENRHQEADSPTSPSSPITPGYALYEGGPGMEDLMGQLSPSTQRKRQREEDEMTRIRSMSVTGGAARGRKHDAVEDNSPPTPPRSTLVGRAPSKGKPKSKSRSRSKSRGRGSGSAKRGGKAKSKGRDKTKRKPADVAHRERSESEVSA